MRREQLAVVQGWADTRTALSRWNARPSMVLRPWALASLAVAVLLLAGTWLVATLSTPDPFEAYFPGLWRPAHLGDFGFVLFRNGLVLMLHALACVAGFMAGSSLPQVAKGYSGLWRRVHELAGPLAIAFVGAATLFSLFTQAYTLGGTASNLAASLGIFPAGADPRPAAARAAGAVRALPAARRVDPGEPPGPVAGVARRHVRDDRARRADPARVGGDRGLGVTQGDARAGRLRGRIPRYTF